MFVAKCIQDGRRVDLPLSQPFFKLMCMPWEKGIIRNPGTVAEEEEEEEEEVMEDREQVTLASRNTPLRQDTSSDTSNNEDRDRGRNTTSPEQRRESSSDLFILDSGGVVLANEASHPHHHGEAGAKEAELVLANHMTEISKDGCPKDRVTLEQVEGEGPEERGWFEDILERADLLEVNPYQGKFLQQLDLLVQQRDAIRAKEELSGLEKEKEVAELTLPGSEENIPGASLENLW